MTCLSWSINTSLLGVCIVLLSLMCPIVRTSQDRETSSDADGQLPRVFLGLLARNTAHMLPNFLGYLERLDYPKSRISLWIRTDHNSDNTSAVFAEWAENVREMYETVDFKSSTEWLYLNFDPFEEHDERFVHVAKLRQEGLEEARRSGADYLLWLDCDIFLVNNRTLRALIEQHQAIVAPMMKTGKESAYSNFWCGMDSRGYYKRTPEYLPILKGEKVGCLPVPVVHSAVLIDLKWTGSEHLRYWPALDDFVGPVDEITQFAYSAKVAGLPLHILNTEMFGYMVRPGDYQDFSDAVSHFVNFKLENLVDHPPVLYSQYVSRPPVNRDNSGLDAVFMIGLVRRPERRNRMIACLEELHFNYTLFDAVDGRKLNQSYLDSLSIKYLPGWKDPWGERPMTFGEVGCFLSHHTIWQKVVTEGLEEILILEDDVVFEPYFRYNLEEVLKEAREFTPNWDLIYVGRKALHWKDEQLVSGASKLVWPRYSYWTLGYLLSQRGARKLLEARPFEKMLPVDEYLPIMFNVHPETDWSGHFPVRNLETYSAFPLLAHPTHYVGDAGWFSDTEPPMEILNQIRARKEAEEKKKKESSSHTAEEKNKESSSRQAKIKEQATQRQIEALKAKLKAKSEL